MLLTLIRREVLDNLLSLRFVIAYCLVTALLVGSASIMLGQYLTQKRVHEVSGSMFQARESEGREFWAGWSGRYVSRPPLVTQMLAIGGQKDADTRALVSPDLAPDFYGSLRRNPLGNLFPAVDMVFVVGIVFSLMVFMLSYDSMSGEREQGTLKVLLASAVPRDTVLLGKWLGGFVSVSLPYVTACILICLILVAHRSVTVTLDDWVRIVAVFAACLLYIAVVFSLAMAVTVTTRSSAVAALVLLLVWVGWFVSLPLLSTPVAQLLVRPASVYGAELTMWRMGTLAWRERGQHSAEQTLASMGARSREDLSESARERFDQQVQENWHRFLQQEADSILIVRRTQLMDQMAVERISRWISRLSPYGSLQNACLALAGTGLQREIDLQNAMDEYYRRAIAAGPPARGGRTPAFSVRPARPSAAIRDSLTDVGVLSVMGLLLFMLAYAAFLRQDLL
jgi:ABC-type transport system involved in multi-copper enzyme maturation permease subunit